MKNSEDFLSLLRTKPHYHCLKVKYKERKGPYCKKFSKDCIVV